MRLYELKAFCLPLRAEKNKQLLALALTSTSLFRCAKLQKIEPKIRLQNKTKNKSRQLKPSQSSFCFQYIISVCCCNAIKHAQKQTLRNFFFIILLLKHQDVERRRSRERGSRVSAVLRKARRAAGRESSSRS